MNTDNATTAVGAATALAVMSQIDFTGPHWWKQALVALGILALGYYSNKPSPPRQT